MQTLTEIAKTAVDLPSVPPTTLLTGPPREPAATQLELPLPQRVDASQEDSTLKGCTFGVVVSAGSSRLAVEHAQKRMAEQGGRVTLLAPATELAAGYPLRFDDDSPLQEVHSLTADRFHEFALVLLGPALEQQSQDEIRSWLQADKDWPRSIALGSASAELLGIEIDHQRIHDASAIEEFITVCEHSLEAS